MYNSSKYAIYYYPNSLGVDLAYRIGPNHSCEIVDIAAKVPGNGTGTKVFNEFENELSNKGIKSLFAFTRYTNNKAKKWYERMGFVSTLIPSYYHDEPNNLAWLLTKML